MLELVMKLLTTHSGRRVYNGLKWNGRECGMERNVSKWEVTGKKVKMRK